MIIGILIYQILLIGTMYEYDKIYAKLARILNYLDAYSCRILCKDLFQ